MHTPETPGVECSCEEESENCFNLELSEDDEQYLKEEKTCFPLVRSAPSPDIYCRTEYRNQINQISAFIDASTVYGVTHELNDALRDENSDCGELKTSQIFNTMGHGETLPQSSEFKCPVALNLLKEDCFQVLPFRLMW